MPFYKDMVTENIPKSQPRSLLIVTVGLWSLCVKAIARIHLGQVQGHSPSARYRHLSTATGC